MTFHWGIAQLNGQAMATDPRISLMNLIKSEWEESAEDPFTIPLVRIHVATKNEASAKNNLIIIEKMRNAPPEEMEIGNARKRVSDMYRIYVSAKGFSQINNAYLMVQHLDDILDANVQALTSAGIDEIHVTDIDLIDDVDSSKFRDGLAEPTVTTTYIMRVRLVYDKVLVEDV